jgi:ankyrin repeat protein
MKNFRSALQWAFQQKQLDIASVLPSYGSCAADISALGWTPAFFVWPTLSKGVSSMVEYIKLIGNDVSVEWEVLDMWNWTVLDRAAAFGTGDEVEALLMFGANPATIALPLRWTALHHAVFYGNLETFLVLIDPKYNASIHSVDARG